MLSLDSDEVDLIEMVLTRFCDECVDQINGTGQYIRVACAARHATVFCKTRCEALLARIEDYRNDEKAEGANG